MHVIHWARTGQGCTPVFPAKERNAELSRKSKIVRTGSTEAQDRNVIGLREASFRPVYSVGPEKRLCISDIPLVKALYGVILNQTAKGDERYG